ncbi:MAG: sigma-54-dependent Fis family transcriptional regulator [Citrobacter freundii]|nr:MAG: sigma-54-dependent Fis family transcriptional regulator [Citrobacter freundii]
MKERILIVEDEFIVANDLRMTLQEKGYSVCGIAGSVEHALQLLDTEKPDWVLLDITLSTPLTGVELAKVLHRKKIPFLFISANTSQRILESAKATQPYGFLVKPFRERDLFIMLDIARYRYGIETGAIKNAETTSAKKRLSDSIIGSSPAFAAAMENIRMVAPTNTSVLLLGETGTGKESAARAIHQLSGRRNQPMITVNCAAMPLTLLESELFGYEKGAFTGASQRRIGKFEQANGGTIFLDEIGEMALDAQVKLLRVLQEKQIERVGGDGLINVDVRIIAATNRNLEKEVAEGRFRLDLYYRLKVFPVELPPLRQRLEDIELLATFFLEKYCQAAGKTINGFSEAVIEQLRSYTWPGNIRELEHLIERTVVLESGTKISTIHLPAEEAPPSLILPEGSTLQEIEKSHILKVLKQCNGRVSGTGGAAEVLGIPAQTLFSKLKKLGIKPTYG